MVDLVWRVAVPFMCSFSFDLSRIESFEALSMVDLLGILIDFDALLFVQRGRSWSY